jgi:hypothetical protein
MNRENTKKHTNLTFLPSVFEKILNLTTTVNEIKNSEMEASVDFSKTFSRSRILKAVFQ